MMTIPKKYKNWDNMKELTPMSKILKVLRLRAGYSQETLGKILGVNRSTYSYIELSYTKPQIEYLEKLARLYKVDISLFFRTDFDIEFSDEWLNRRPKKIGNGEMDNVNELAPKERALIALVRSRPHKVLEDILNKYN